MLNRSPKLDFCDSVEGRPFGYQLSLDLYNCRPGVCDDLEHSYRFLEELVVTLEMKKQSPPFIFKSDHVAYPDKAGLSGWIPLIESGIQIHTLSCKNFISIDVYSCRRFDIDQVIEYVRAWFSPVEIESHFSERGAKYWLTDSNKNTLEEQDAHSLHYNAESHRR